MSKHRLFFALVALNLLMVGLACNLLTRQSEPDIVTEPEKPAVSASDVEALHEALAAEVDDHRPEVFAYLGRPDAFDIAIIEVEGVPVRMETWRYYQFGTQVDFVDGNALWVIEIDPMPEGTIFAAWYNPLDFFDGITGSQAIRNATASSPAGIEPHRIDLSEGGEDLAGGFAMVGDQILMGIYEDQVVYIETIALVPEGGLQ